MEYLTCTKILNIMTVLGFMANYMLRVNLSIAVVDMLDTNATTQVQRFNWDVEQRNTLLGAFFWGYMIPTILGGRLSETLGPRLIFGGGMLTASIVTVLQPATCYIHFYLAVAARVALGMCLGVTYPAIGPLAVKWIPPSNRSKFMAHMLAQGLGVAVSLPVCGLLISCFGWPSVFYCTGLLGLTWSCLWFYLVYDSPASHPRISPEERQEIESQMGPVQTVSDKPQKMPWGQILLSLPAWAVIVAHSFIAYCQFMNITQLPTYLRDVFAFDIQQNGLLSSLPNLGQYCAAILAGFCADKIRKSDRLSTLATRKLFASLTCFVPAILTLMLIWWGRSVTVAMFFMTTSISLIGFMSAGHLPNCLEISPNFCGTIMGIATAISSIAGWLATKTVAIVTKDDSSINSWNTVFIIMVVVYTSGGLFFVLFADGNVQKWNSNKKEDDEEERKSLNVKIEC